MPKIGLGNHIENESENISHLFDIFTNNRVDTSMQKGYEQEIHLTSALTNTGPFEFFIPPSSDFIHLPKTRLVIEGRILLQADNGNPAAAAQIGICNLFPQSLFKQVDVTIGNINTSSQDNMYAYKSYFETLFSYSKIAKSSHLKDLCGWIEDEVGLQDATLLAPIAAAGAVAAQNENKGWVNRRALVSQGRLFNFSIPIHADIFQCNKLIPPNTPIRIVLTRNTDAFSLICADAAANVFINLTKLNLFVRRIIPTDKVVNYFATHLPKKEVILPFSRSVIKKETIPAGITNYSLKLFSGESPRQLLFCMVQQNRVEGRRNINPFHFQHFDVNFINLRINGMSTPSKPFQPDFANEVIARLLRSLYDSTGVGCGDGSYGLSRAQFLNGHTFFAYDLSADQCNGLHEHQREIGKTIELDLIFNAALANVINVLIYATFETELRLLNGQGQPPNFING